MRLIDADKFITEIEINIGNIYNPEIIKGMRFSIELINSRPTEFDKEKVMSELSEKYKKSVDIYNVDKKCDPLSVSKFIMEAYENSIDIVKKGGVE